MATTTTPSPSEAVPAESERGMRSTAKAQASSSGGTLTIIEKAIGLLVIGVLSWELMATQEHSRAISAYDEKFKSLEATTADLRQDVRNLSIQLNQSFRELREEIRKK